MNQSTAPTLGCCPAIPIGRRRPTIREPRPNRSDASALQIRRVRVSWQVSTLQAALQKSQQTEEALGVEVRDAPRSVTLYGLDSHDLPGFGAARLFYSLTVDGVATSRFLTSRSATLVLSPGKHAVSLTVTDRAGNRSTSAVMATTLTARSRPTPATLTAPISRQVTTRSVRVAWRASTASWGARIVTYRITVNGKPFAATGPVQTSLVAKVGPGAG